MGAGFALFVAAARCRARGGGGPGACGVPAWVAGRVEAGPKRLLIEPLDLRFDGDALQLR